MLPWLRSSTRFICHCPTRLSSQLLPSTKTTITQISTITRLSSLSPPATSTPSKSTYTLLPLEAFLATKSQRFSIGMASTRLKTTSKLLTDISPLLRDCRLIYMSSTFTASWFYPFMILRIDGSSMKPRVKDSCRPGILRVPRFLWYLCWEDTPWMMAESPLIGTLHSQETRLILSADWVSWHLMTRVSGFGS